MIMLGIRIEDRIGFARRRGGHRGLGTALFEMAVY